MWQDDVGSTLFQTDRPYFKLDDETTLVSAKTDPVGFVRQINTAIIDEVQRAPEASYFSRFSSHMRCEASMSSLSSSITHGYSRTMCAWDPIRCMPRT